jgi:hypothetical protein
MNEAVYGQDHSRVSNHWHLDNPFADRAIYVPLAELAKTYKHLNEYKRTLAGNLVKASERDVLAHWCFGGRKIVDAYVIGCSAFGYSAGVRYGAQGHEVLTPYGDHDLLEGLADEYGPTVSDTDGFFDGRFHWRNAQGGHGLPERLFFEVKDHRGVVGQFAADELAQLLIAKNPGFLKRLLASASKKR